jgi:S1-C subfamily serine protease
VYFSSYSAPSARRGSPPIEFRSHSSGFHVKVLFWCKKTISVVNLQGGVSVTKLLKGAPPKKAGLKVGDVITGVDGKAAVDTETFRRLLRHGTVLEETKFAMKRDGEEITVTASFLGCVPPALKPVK